MKWLEVIPKWLSYLWPISIKKVNSPINGILELGWHNGKKVLNTVNVNYSFGNLHAVMQFAIKEMGKHNVLFNKVLILGYCGGSAAEIIRNKYNKKAQILGVDIDKMVIELAKTHFYHTDVEFIEADALNFIRSNKSGQRFDVIIVDLFIDNQEATFTKEFANNLKLWLNPNGMIAINSMKSAQDGQKIGRIFEDEGWKGEVLKVLTDNYVWLFKA